MAETRTEILNTGSDLLCYRAEAPEELAERQRLAFDPILAWAAETLGARFNLAAGIMHVGQPPQSIEAIRSAIEDFDDPVALAALSAMTTLSGSALLALAVARGRLSLRRRGGPPMSTRTSRPNAGASMRRRARGARRAGGSLRRRLWRWRRCADHSDSQRFVRGVFHERACDERRRANGGRRREE